MTANVTIDVAEVKDILRIPNGALRFRPEPQKGDDAKKKAAENRQGGGDTDRSAIAMGQRGRGIGGAAGAMGGGPPRKRPQTVHVMGADKKLKPVEIRTGISDGRYTQVVEGGLKAGDEIVVGLATTKVEGPAAFGGGMQGGGGQRGGGGRGR